MSKDALRMSRVPGGQFTPDAMRLVELLNAFVLGRRTETEPATLPEERRNRKRTLLITVGRDTYQRDNLRYLVHNSDMHEILVEYQQHLPIYETVKKCVSICSGFDICCNALNQIELFGWDRYRQMDSTDEKLVHLPVSRV